jgi:hypothetical protein
MYLFLLLSDILQVHQESLSIGVHCNLKINPRLLSFSVYSSLFLPQTCYYSPFTHSRVKNSILLHSLILHCLLVHFGELYNKKVKLQ